MSDLSTHEPEPGKWSIYRDHRNAIVIHVPGWDEFGDRRDVEHSIADETALRLLAELNDAIHPRHQFTKP